MDERYILNYNNISPDQLSHPQSPVINYGTKRPAFKTGLDTREEIINNLHQNEEISKDTNRLLACSSSRESNSHQTILGGKTDPKTVLPNGKKTKGRVKIKMEFIDNKLRRYTTFSKRKTGIMKKAYELSTLTGTQVMLLVASETGHVYTFATRKLQPMITSESGKALIQTCLNSPDPLASGASPTDQRMSATGFEETELTYAVNEDESKVRLDLYATHSESSPLPNLPESSPPISSPNSSPNVAVTNTSLPVHPHSHPYHQLYSQVQLSPSQPDPPSLIYQQLPSPEIKADHNTSPLPQSYHSLSNSSYSQSQPLSVHIPVTSALPPVSHISNSSPVSLYTTLSYSNLIQSVSNSR